MSQKKFILGKHVRQFKNKLATEQNLQTKNEADVFWAHTSN